MTDYNKEFVELWPAVRILNNNLAKYQDYPTRELRLDILDTLGDLEAIRCELDDVMEQANTILDGKLKPLGRVTL